MTTMQTAYRAFSWHVLRRWRGPAWRREHAVRLWSLHKDADYFLARGGAVIPPPMACNLSLTNKCNLRCELCGSQTLLDRTGTPRRHMDKALMEAVAETLFPFIVDVELNSQGDPLLYPHIGRVLELLAEHRCRYSIQTNGTLFSDAIIEQLVAVQGVVKMSLDAVGPKLDEVRRGANWARAEPQILKLLNRRNRTTNPVWLYPTITQRTFPEMKAIVKWAEAVGIDRVVFHHYDPVEGADEAPVDDEVVRSELERCGQWLKTQKAAVQLRLQNEVFYEGWQHEYKFFSHRDKELLYVSTENFPVEARGQGADPHYLCPVPTQYLDIGLDGQISVCCRSQDVPIGYATSKEAFADAWFGPNYQLIRDSLRRDATGPLPLPACESCIGTYAPKELKGRVAVDYGLPGDPTALSCNDEIIPVLDIRRDSGHCFIARLPLGLEAGAYLLHEDGRPLYLSGTLHGDIRSLGGGRNSVWGNSLYFSASDNSDVTRNGRRYELRRVAIGDGTRIGPFMPESGHCHVALLPVALPPGAFDVCEDGRPLAGGAMHEEIRMLGAGRYSLWDRSVYLSASDNSDPSTNGRTYTLRSRVTADPARKGVAA